jgi:hypothetical protein
VDLANAAARMILNLLTTEAMAPLSLLARAAQHEIAAVLLTGFRNAFVVIVCSQA